MTAQQQTLDDQVPDITVAYLSKARRRTGTQGVLSSKHYPPCHADFSCPYQLHTPKGGRHPLATPRCLFAGTCNQQRNPPPWEQWTL